MATVLYFVPHQDDDVLVMGVSIAQHVAAGHDVKVILCTDGQSSSVRFVLSDTGSCTKNAFSTKDTHNAELTPGINGTFVSCRDLEFRTSLKALGVRPENIIIPPVRVIDGYSNQNFSDAVAKFESIVSQYINNPSLRVKLISPYTNDQHNDHKALGRAIINVCNRVGVTDIRYYVEPWLIDRYAGMIMPWKEFAEKNSDIGTKVRNACIEYGIWAPAHKRYAIAFHSVHQFFLEAMGNTTKHDSRPTNYVHS